MARKSSRRPAAVIDCADLDKAGVLRALDAAFGLGEQFGANFDALYDGMAELIQEKGGFELELDNWSARRMTRKSAETLLAVFSELAEEFGPGHVRVRVISFRCFCYL